MGLLNLLMSAAGKCFEAVGVLLDLNFLVVHALVRTVLGVLGFVYHLPGALVNVAAHLAGLGASCTSGLASGAACALGGAGVAWDGLLESLKMVGYLAAHCLLRGKQHLCRAVLWLPQACGGALALLLYSVNAAASFVLAAAQKVSAALLGALHALAGPLHRLLEVTMAAVALLHGGLVWTGTFLWSPCRLLLDFALSLAQMFISIFILNVYGLLLTALIAFTATAYLNPELARQAGRRLLGLVDSSPALRSVRRALPHLGAAPRRLSRVLHHLRALERRLWRQASGLGGRLSLSLRTQLHRSSRVGGDGEPGDDRRDPPDGSPEARRRRADPRAPSSSASGPPEKRLSSGKEGTRGPENLLTLLKEQEERKKCVICQDCNKTVVLLPCRHLCLCRGCKDILLRQPLHQQNCPLCRHMILSTVDVYL